MTLSPSNSRSGGSVPFVGADPPGSPTDGELWWDTDDDTPVGGSQPSTATATVTTDPDTFLVSHVFDLGEGVHPVKITKTLVATTPDGETFSFAGGIGVTITLITNTQPPQGSTDGLTYYNFNPVLASIVKAAPGAGASTDLYAIGTSSAIIYTSPRYLKIYAAIEDFNTGDLYAGANHPTAQVRFDLEYL